MKLGSTISHIRKSKGIKQEDLAEWSDITQAYLSLIENDRKEPNLGTLKRISESLETPLPIIFFLSLDDSDIQQDKKQLVDEITPLIENLIKNLNA